MSAIAVDGLPAKISLLQVVKMLGKCIGGQFDTLQFLDSDCSTSKTCLLHLSDKLDPVEVIEKINSMAHGKKRNILNAYIPDISLNLPIEGKWKNASKKSRKNSGPNPRNMTPVRVLVLAHLEIMTELQHKYTGLYNLSSKGSHTLLEAIGMTIYDRLHQLQASGAESANPFLLTQRYRKVHPHFGDFQLILDTLHRLEAAAGTSRTHVQESDLTVTPKDLTVIDSVPYTKAQDVVSKYTTRIIEKLGQHVSNYDLTPNPEDDEEKVARKKVQAELAKMIPYLPAMMSQIVLNHFSDSSAKTYHRMRMYGEPFLPGKELTVPLMKRFGALRVARWKTMYNLLVFNVPPINYAKIMALDGTNLGGAKIVIRSSNPNIYRMALSSKNDATECIDLEDDEEEADYDMEE